LHSCGGEENLLKQALRIGYNAIDPLIAGPAVSVLIAAGVIGVGAMTGLLPSGLSPKQGDARPADPGSQSIPPTSCALCGHRRSIRTIEYAMRRAMPAQSPEGSAAPPQATGRTAEAPTPP